MAPRRNKPIIKLEGFAMRFKKMKKGGKELWYCVERERRDEDSVRSDVRISLENLMEAFKHRYEDSVRSDVRISLENLMEAFKHRYKSNFSDVSSASGFEGNVLMSDLLMKVKEEEEHTRMDAEELRLDPNFQVNRSRRLSNVMKDKRLIKVLENSPLPPRVATGRAGPRLFFLRPGPAGSPGQPSPAGSAGSARSNLRKNRNY